MCYRHRFILLLALYLARPALADTTVCVHTPAEFQTALTGAQASSAFTLIEVARGTYNLGGTELTFNGTGTGQLDISGGYNADCSTQILNPALTVLDGQYLSPVMTMYAEGGVSIRYLTFQHGSSTAVYGGGLFADIQGSSGGLILNYNIFRANVGEEDVGVYALMDNGSTGDLRANGNLFVDNTAVNYNPAGEIQIFGTGNLYMVNNTVANNVITGTGAISGSMFVGGGTTATLSNNIFWGNDVADLNIGLVVLVDNDVGVLQGTPASGSSGSTSIDPQFSGTTDYHLLPASPLLGAGTLTPAGNLPTIDIEGHPRSYNGLVDVGAYERGDVIYVNGFDD